MRLLLLPIVAAASVSAQTITPSDPDPTRSKGSASRDNCLPRIEQVREASGQPSLDRSPGVRGEGFLIAAVDKRVDGCAVMQMHRDVNDLRPLPAPSSGPARLTPAR